MAASSRFTKMALTASARAYPSADASNVLQDPSAEKILSPFSDCCIFGFRMMLDPATTADVQSPCAMAWQAKCRQIPDPEQPTLTVIL